MSRNHGLLRVYSWRKPLYGLLLSEATTPFVESDQTPLWNELHCALEDLFVCFKFLNVCLFLFPFDLTLDLLKLDVEVWSSQTRKRHLQRVIHLIYFSCLFYSDTRYTWELISFSPLLSDWLRFRHPARGHRQWDKWILG